MPTAIAPRLLRPLLAAALLILTACASDSKPAHNGIRLIAGDWTLRSIDGRALPESVRREQRPPGLTIGTDGKVTGFGGVNSLSSSVDVGALDNGTVTFQPFISTRMAGPPEAMDTEGRFTSALARINRYVLDGPSLVLLDNTTELLRFDPRARPGN